MALDDGATATEGWVFNIQRFSLHDGPGIRTTVFFKGCPLRCQWCHNPEGLERRPQVRLTASLCAHCGRCVSACDQGGHEVSAETHALHLDHCTRCGQCVDACPAGALEMVGTSMTADLVMSIVRRDVPFYETSGGGMTLSGGEPLAQFAFARRLLEIAREEAIHTAIETSAFAPWERLEALGPLVDLFMVDLKHTDDERHMALTGVSNKPVLANIRRLADAGWPLVLRVPWVPTRNTGEDMRDGLLRFVTSLPGPPTVEFMPYHRLGVGKWEALGGGPSPMADVPAAAAEDVAASARDLTDAGVQTLVR